MIASAARLALVTLAVLAAVPASAQELFPRFDFHFDAEYVVSDDRRFNWIFDFGGDIDVVRAGNARAIFIANYEAIAGEEFRRFDVNQGNYLLEGAVLFRVGRFEAGPVWHHVSRHLSDRSKRFPIDWNMLALRVRRAAQAATLEYVWQVDGRVTVTNAFVDYNWETEGRGDVKYRLSPRWSAIGNGSLRIVGTDGSRERGTQAGGGGEIGLRFEGSAAAAELFLGAERRIDPYPFEFDTGGWFLAGLRLMSR